MRCKPAALVRCRRLPRLRSHSACCTPCCRPRQTSAGLVLCGGRPLAGSPRLQSSPHFHARRLRRRAGAFGLCHPAAHHRGHRPRAGTGSGEPNPDRADRILVAMAGISSPPSSPRPLRAPACACNGFIPCPLTSFMMTYAAAHGAVKWDLLLSAVFAAGMALTVARLLRRCSLGHGFCPLSCARRRSESVTHRHWKPSRPLR